MFESNLSRVSSKEERKDLKVCCNQQSVFLYFKITALMIWLMRKMENLSREALSSGKIIVSLHYILVYIYIFSAVEIIACVAGGFSYTGYGNKRLGVRYHVFLVKID